MKKKLKLALKNEDGTLAPYVVDFGLSTPEPHPAYVEVVAFNVDLLLKAMRITFCMGAYDLQDRFRPSPDFRIATIGVNGPSGKHKAFWDAKIAGHTVFDLDEMKDWLVELGAIGTAGTMFWGMPNLVDEATGGKAAAERAATAPCACAPGTECK